MHPSTLLTSLNNIGVDYTLERIETPLTNRKEPKENNEERSPTKLHFMTYTQPIIAYPVILHTPDVIFLSYIFVFSHTN